jgi:hypothetical protein
VDVIVQVRVTVSRPGIFALVNAHFLEKRLSDCHPVFSRPAAISGRQRETAGPDCLFAIWSELPIQTSLAGHFSRAAGQAAADPFAAGLATF